jgi:hypothetical protein
MAVEPPIAIPQKSSVRLIRGARVLIFAKLR